AFAEYQPDAILVLGDRYELLGICSAAVLMRIPIVHLHGGEITEGAVDEMIRHAVTKMAALHFVAAEPYRQRVIQMGERPDRVFNVGAAGLDVMNHISFLPRDHLEQDLNVTLTAPVLLVTYHPVTRHRLQPSTDEQNSKIVDRGLQALFAALEALGDATVIWTGANTDSGGQAVNEAVQAWSKQTSMTVKVLTSLGIQRYLSLMSYCDAVVGNSSSGLIEAPAMGVPTVNIGDRQKGRLRAPSVLDCDAEASAIEMALRQAFTPAFKQLAAEKPSVYGHGQTAETIVQLLRRFLRESATDLSVKPFYDLAVASREGIS
ncbi:MAG: UDP-N-acetylglucosamine 2-epimerase, partial [Hydrogenovibrio sp.]